MPDNFYTLSAIKKDALKSLDWTSEWKTYILGGACRTSCIISNIQRFGGPITYVFLLQ